MCAPALFLLASPLCVAPAPVAPAQYGQEYLLTQQADYSSDVVAVPPHPLIALPPGFATLETIEDPSLPGTSDLLVTRLDDHHNVLWERRLGGPDVEVSRNMVVTQDGGLVISAFSRSTPSVQTRTVMAKFDGHGSLRWVRSYPGEEFPGLESGISVTELGDGNLVLVSGVRGQLASSIDAVVILTDPTGAPIGMWRHDPNGNLPARIIYKSVISRDQDCVAVGMIQRELPTGVTITHTIVNRFMGTCGCPIWVNEYPLTIETPDWANAVAWTANDELVVAGNTGPFLTADTAYALRLSAVSGLPRWTNIYPRMLLQDVVEDRDPASPSQGDKLCFAGWKIRVPDVLPVVEFDATLMITDPGGAPLRNMVYDPDPLGFAVSVVPHYPSQGFSVPGYFALATSLSTLHVAPGHQHWIQTDLGLKSGCKEEEYLQPILPALVDPIAIHFLLPPLDGGGPLPWDVVNAHLELIDLCLDPVPVTSLCFGDGSGTACPCGNAGASGEGCANSTGAGAVLSAGGSSSISGDTLVLQVSQGKPGQPVLFFQGINFIAGGSGVTFGDGLRCCGGSIQRLQVRAMNASGTASTTISISAAGSASVGDIFCYQGWYRDPSSAGGSPCLNFFNLTSALSITWLP